MGSLNLVFTRKLAQEKEVKSKLVPLLQSHLFRRMPLVPTMIQELVHALPPLGESQVCDLLGRNLLVLKHIDLINSTNSWQWGSDSGSKEILSKMQYFCYREMSIQVSIETTAVNWFFCNSLYLCNISE